jgi:hypothetical protein
MLVRDMHAHLASTPMFAGPVDAYVGRATVDAYVGRATVDAYVGRATVDAYVGRDVPADLASTPMLAVDAYVAAPALARRVPGSAPRLAGCARADGAFAAAGVRGGARCPPARHRRRPRLYVDWCRGTSCRANAMALPPHGRSSCARVT